MTVVGSRSPGGDAPVVGRSAVHESVVVRSPGHGAGQVAGAGGLPGLTQAAACVPQRRLWPSNTLHRRRTLHSRESPAGKYKLFLCNFYDPTLDSATEHTSRVSRV